MTVGELREALKNYDDDTVVEIYSEKYNDSTFIDKIDEYEKGFVELVINDSRWNMKGFPTDATNGDVIKAMYPKGKVRREKSWTSDRTVFSFPDGTYFGAECRFNTDWWNAPYEGGGVDERL